MEFITQFGYQCEDVSKFPNFIYFTVSFFVISKPFPVHSFSYFIIIIICCQILLCLRGGILNYNV